MEVDSKKMYKRAKIIAKVYNVPLYIAWNCRYFPQKILNIIKNMVINKKKVRL